MCERNNNFSKIVSYTTRPKRENEREGIDYHYITNDEFSEKILNGDMLEATYFNHWHYGTSKESWWMALILVFLILMDMIA